VSFGPLDLTRRPDLPELVVSKHLTALPVAGGVSAVAHSDPYIKRVGDRRVGVLSAAPPVLLGATRLGDPAAQVLASLARARAQCDLLILISHMGLEADRRVLARLPQPGAVDLLIETQEAVSSPEVTQEAGTALYLPRRGGGEVGEIQLDASRAQPAFRVLLHPITNEQPMLQEVYEAAATFLAEHTSPPAASAALPRGDWGYAPASKCVQCHPRQSAAWAGTPHAAAAQRLEAEGRLARDCLRCHSEYQRRTRAYARLPQGDDGVQCATCHGDGILHSLTGGRGDILRRVPEAVCRDCHTPERSPAFRYSEWCGRVRH